MKNSLMIFFLGWFVGVFVFFQNSSVDFDVIFYTSQLA